jgi:hypothetical protein
MPDKDRMWRYFSVVTSVVAFVISLWSFYFGYIYQESSLIGLVGSFDMNNDMDALEKEPNDIRSKLTFEIHVVNGGNRPAALLKVGWSIMRADTMDCEKAPISFSSPVQLVVEPAKIQKSSVSIDYSFGFDELGGSKRAVESCLTFFVMDHAGHMHSRTFPALSASFGDAKTGPGLIVHIDKPLKLL